jgi:zinc transporter
MVNKNETTDPGLICAFDLDGKGGGRELGWLEINEPQQPEVVRWIHLDHTARDSRSWLAKESGLDESIIDAMLETETRPRCLQTRKGILLVMRGVNLNPEAEFEDMVSIRVWLDSDRIITTRHRKLQSMQKIRDELLGGIGPKDQAEFLELMTRYLGDNIAGIIDSLDESLDQLEAAIGVGGASSSHGELGSLRRKTAHLRRYLSPQREALDRLSRSQSELLTPGTVAEIHQEANRMVLFVEELDLARERAMVIREEMISNLAQDQNAKMYLLSMVAAVFLPLSFISGVMGMNTAGLPGIENTMAFWIVVALMLLIGIGILWVFRWKRWM